MSAGAGMVIGSAIGAGGSIFGASEQAKAAREAAAAQERIAAANLAWQKDMYAQNTERMQPWVDFGTSQMNTLSEMMPSLTSKYSYSDYLNSPEYQNTLASTDRARNSMLAQGSASGMYGSGTMANQLQSNAAYLAQQGYQQGLSNEMSQRNNIFNMLNSGSNTGLQAAGQQNLAGSTAAGQVGQTYNNLATGLSNALTNEGNAWGNMYNSLGNLGMNLASQYSQYSQGQDQVAAMNALSAQLAKAQSPSSAAFMPQTTFGGLWSGIKR